ncbi:UDP-glucose 4-epimerase GalE [Candidatus Woesearchaeota archaeon]|nr:UDP-glucose 4-epimerase GalE [Candidatus Woesearchaeota archaeon]
MKILVTGGSGYIGSHTVRLLLKAGYEVVVYDNLVYGHKESLPEDIPFVHGDLADKELLIRTFNEHNIDAVIHFASYIVVSESCTDPIKYFRNNTLDGFVLLEAMKECGVKRIVFSSSAAVYGDPVNVPIKETDPKLPTNAYGDTKLIFETMLKWFDSAYGIKFAALRYFNASGASESGDIGEDHDPETHLIPLVVQAAMGQRDSITIFGEDYETPDGTCVRDYVHVNDLAKAHIKALEYIKDNPSDAFNLGSGTGYSVKEIIDMVEEVSGVKLTREIGERRDGDPPKLVADHGHAKDKLGWEPEYDLRRIIETAWNWHKSHPDGYR